MSSESPFREEDLQARVEALRVERDELARALEDALRQAGRNGTWSWWRFLMGALLLPTAIVMSIVLVSLFN
jgi:hypothetical protein